MNRIPRIALLIAAFAALALPAPAFGSYRDVIKDCAQDGQLNRHYSHDELVQARNHLPTDVREYTDCAGVIDAALVNGGGGTSTNGGSGGGGGGAGGGGGTGAAGGGASTQSGATGSPAAVSSLTHATNDLRRSRPSIALGSQTITPTAHGLSGVPGAANELPLSLLLAIIAVAGLCAVAGAAAAWRQLPALVRAPLRFVRR